MNPVVAMPFMKSAKCSQENEREREREAFGSNSNVVDVKRGKNILFCDPEQETKAILVLCYYDDCLNAT